VRCEDPLKAYLNLKDSRNVIYHAVMAGDGNLWVISKGEIDIDGEILVSGLRSDYYVAYAPVFLWNESIEEIRKMITEFDPKQSRPQNAIVTHRNEPLDWWDDECEILFRNLKYNAREKFTKILKQHLISRSKFYKFLERLDEACIVFTRYFPKGI
jgi:hypothetical protein